MAVGNKESEKQAPGGDGSSSRLEAPAQAEMLPPLKTINMTFAHECLFIVLICMAQFMTQVSVGQTIAILHYIGDSFDITNSGELSWFMASFSLTVGTFILPSGRWGDLFGYKKLYLIGLAWYALWTLAAGVSVYSGKVLFNFARALQGIGPAICLPNALAIFGTKYKPGLKKTMVFSIFGASAPLGSVTGAVFGGLFVNGSNWQWAFYSNCIALVVIAVMTYLFVPSAGREQYAPDIKTCIWRLDPYGSVLGVTALVLISFAWNQAPVVGWHQPYVYVTLILGIVCVGAFLYVEDHVAEHPLIPLQYMNVDTSAMLLCLWCGWSTFGIFIFYIWQFFEELRHASPLLASAWYSTNGVSGVAATILTGIFLEKMGPAKAMVLALLSFLIGIILIATAPIDQSYWYQSFWCLVIIPFGMDISFPAATVIISDQFPAKRQGIGASLVNTVVNYSISLGLGFAGTVEVHVNNGGRTRDDLLAGYRGAFYMGIGFAALGTALSLAFWAYTWIRGKRVDKVGEHSLDEALHDASDTKIETAT